MGRLATRTACFPRFPSPPRRGIPRRTSPFTRSAARRSWPIRNGAAGAIWKKRPVRARACRWPAWPAHITYLSDEALHRKFGRNLQDREALTYGFDADFQVESYLRHQGSTFVDRFDANSYLYLTRAMDYFDLAADHGGSLAAAFEGTGTLFCVVSFTSDWLFPTEENRAIVQALNAVAANVSFVEIETDGGHDSFLLDEPELFDTVSGFLNAAARRRGLQAREPADAELET